MNSLTNYFIIILDEISMYDIPPIKLRPTWINKRIDQDRIAKRLDRFIINEGTLQYVVSIR